MSNPVEERIEREMLEAEKAVYGDPNATTAEIPAPVAQPEPIEVEEPVAPVAEETPSEEATVIEPVIPPELDVESEQATVVEPVPAEPQDTTDWKKRFTNMKASSDATIHGLRLENTALRENQQVLTARVGELERTLAEQKPAADVFANVFSEEEQDIVGKEAIEAFKKAALAAAKAEAEPLKAQLKASQEALSKVEKDKLETAQQAEYTSFLTKLEALVPDYLAIDKNPGFAQWMKGADEASGLSRDYIFRNAQRNHDVQRVADFFNAFKIATAPAKNPLEKKVTPSKSAGSQQSSATKEGSDKLSPQQIMKFYDDVAAGHYDKKPDLRDAIEKRIDDQIRQAQTG